MNASRIGFCRRIGFCLLGLSLLIPGASALAEGSWTDRIGVFGDFRGRYEGFWFDEDATGAERDDRHRARYRLRVGFEAQINDYIDLRTRFASGPESDKRTRTRNRTLGEGVDFDPDDFRIEQAYIAFHPFAGREIPAKGKKADLIFGKFSNPWHSKKGKDLLLWDPDLMPEGGAISFTSAPCDCLDLTLNTGYLIVDEEGTASDPHVVPVQLQIALRPNDQLSVGTNLSYYGWRSLNDSFFDRAQMGGAIPGGLTDDSAMDIGDLRAWLEFGGIDGWPILVYGNVVRNFSAENTSGFGAGKEDTGWSAGAVIGDKTKSVQLGAGYFWIEANGVPSNMIDSDLFEAHTSRKGWVIHGARQILKNTELRFEILLSDELDDDLGSLDESGSPIVNPSIVDADRVRLRTDVVVKF
jgi:hypothetical protein